MAGSVFGAADIEVDIFPVGGGFIREIFRIVGRVHIPEVITARSCKSGHGVGFEAAAVGGHPVFSPCQRRFAGFGRQVSIHFGQQQRELRFGQGVWHTVPVIHWERLAPVTLPAENGIAQAEIDRTRPYFHLFGFSNDFRDSLVHLHAADKSRVDHDTVVRVIGLFPRRRIGRLMSRFIHHLDDREVEMPGKGKVTAVVGRNSHDGAGPVTRQYIIGNPHRDFCPRERIQRISARKFPAYLFHLGHALTFRTVFGPGNISIDLVFLLRCCNNRNQFMFRRKDHEGSPENSIRACGKHLYDGIAVFNSKVHIATLAATDPVALDFLERFAPVNSIETL